MLEMIDKGSSTESHPVPLLFVHGGLSRGVVLGRTLPRLLRGSGVSRTGSESAWARSKPDLEAAQ